ncbi:MAG: hypothetical protein ABSH44_09415 [Bryobacteraceae bacterium]|jgi:hypothetical protein
MTCALCEIRRPRRFCPGVRGDICTTCCGTEREVTVTCPLDCEYLREARKHDRITPIAPADIPHRDIRVTDQLLNENEELMAFLVLTFTRAAAELPSVVDFDAREALDALIRTYRTLESGVYYETRPTNPLAASICDRVQAGIAEFRREETRNLGMTKTRDAGILGLLVFLQRFELDRNNGRRRGRAFLDALRAIYAGEPGSPPAASSPLILP